MVGAYVCVLLTCVSVMPVKIDVHGVFAGDWVLSSRTTETVRSA